LKGIISDGMLMPVDSLDAFHLDFKSLWWWMERW
jgi:hypothetical protein